MCKRKEPATEADGMGVLAAGKRLMEVVAVRIGFFGAVLRPIPSCLNISACEMNSTCCSETA